MSIRNRIRNASKEVLSDAWSVLTRHTFEWHHSNGEWQQQVRETYDRGDGVAILLYNAERRAVILTRQLRYPTVVNGWDEMMVEVPAGALEGGDPEITMAREVEEETGYRVHGLKRIFEAFMSPGAVTEAIYFFVGTYLPDDRVSEGGGLVEEGEDIEVLETGFDEAMAMIADGRIRDAKTIMLLQYAALNVFN
ncbi:MAG: NUDIX domain-containing protein [Pseudomonadota bacterium]